MRKCGFCHAVARILALIAADNCPILCLQVKYPDGAIRPTLVPYASLINHSPWPHIVHFSTVDPATKLLQLRSFRPCAQGQQLYLSYGPLSNDQLLVFYGFSVLGNPFEKVELEVEGLGLSKSNSQTSKGPGAKKQQQKRKEAQQSRVITISSTGVCLPEGLVIGLGKGTEAAYGAAAAATGGGVDSVGDQKQRLQEALKKAAVPYEKALERLMKAKGGADGSASGGFVEQLFGNVRTCIDLLQCWSSS